MAGLGLIAWLTGGIVVLTVGIIVVAVQRLYFHPLSHIPGPKLAAVTTWWQAWVDLVHKPTLRLYFEIQELHVQHGPIIRVGPSEVHVSDSKWTRTLFAGPGVVRDKHASLAEIVGRNQATFGTFDHHLHRIRRNAVAPFFSKRAVTNIESKIRYQMEIMCEIIDDVYAQKDGRIEIRETYLAWFTDILTSYIFDKSTDVLRDPKRGQEWSNLFDRLATLYPILQQSIGIVPLAYKTPMWLIKLIVPVLVPDMEAQSKAICDEYKAADGQMKQHQEKPLVDENQPNLFCAILCSNLPEHEKKYQRIAHEGFEIFLAGGSTNSRALVAATYHILANPDVNHKTLISTNKTFLLDDCEIFPEPYCSRPERWLTSDEDRLAYMEKYFVAFGLGARACIGMNFAKASFLMAMVVIFRRYDFELVDAVRERDVNNHRAWLIGEPRPDSPGLFIRPTWSWQDEA